MFLPSQTVGLHERSELSLAHGVEGNRLPPRPRERQEPREIAVSLGRHPMAAHRWEITPMQAVLWVYGSAENAAKSARTSESSRCLSDMKT